MWLGGRHHAKRQRGGDNIKSNDRHIGRSHSERGEQSGAAQGTGNARGIHRRPGKTDRPDQLIVRHDGRDQRTTHTEIGRPDDTHQRRDDKDEQRIEMTGQRQRHQRGGKRCIARAHHRQQIAMADAIADDAEHRGHQRADIAKGSKHGEQQDRPGLDQHVPAENERLHLESPRGEQIGRPLETIIPDPEWSERGRPRKVAQDALSRFIAFHPALFLIVTSWIASWARRFKPRMLPCRGATSTAAVFPPLISRG